MGRSVRFIILGLVEMSYLSRKLARQANGVTMCGEFCAIKRVKDFFANSINVKK